MEVVVKRPRDVFLVISNAHDTTSFESPNVRHLDTEKPRSAISGAVVFLVGRARFPIVIGGILSAGMNFPSLLLDIMLCSRLHRENTRKEGEKEGEKGKFEQEKAEGGRWKVAGGRWKVGLKLAALTVPTKENWRLSEVNPCLWRGPNRFLLHQLKRVPVLLSAYFS